MLRVLGAFTARQVAGVLCFGGDLLRAVASGPACACGLIGLLARTMATATEPKAKPQCVPTAGTPVC
jgi:hypothetical protein